MFCQKCGRGLDENSTATIVCWSEDDTVLRPDLDNLPETLECDDNNIVGCYPFNSKLSETANFSVSTFILNGTEN